MILESWMHDRDILLVWVFGAVWNFYPIIILVASDIFPKSKNLRIMVMLRGKMSSPRLFPIHFPLDQILLPCMEKDTVTSSQKCT